MKTTVVDKFEIQRVGVFADDLAYGSERGIYVLKDRETGKEYIGISGVGLSELGNHQAGKNSIVPDER